jgi:hypothetical protein
MKFKKGDRVEVIWRSELIQGVVAHISEITNELNIKPDFTSQGTILFNQNQVRKVKLVKVPQFVADWIKYCEKHCWGLFEALEDTYENSCMPEEVMDWMENCHENQELFARAWMGGYEVEKEPLYYVRFFDGEVGFLQVYLNGVRLVGWRNKSEEYKVKFTESEIKEMNEKYWAFKVPVEEVSE